MKKLITIFLLFVIIDSNAQQRMLDQIRNNLSEAERNLPELQNNINTLSDILQKARGPNDKEWIPKLNTRYAIPNKVTELGQIINALKNKIENKNLQQIKQSRKELEDLARKALDIIIGKNNLQAGMKDVFTRRHNDLQITPLRAANGKISDLVINLKNVIADLQSIQK